MKYAIVTLGWDFKYAVPVEKLSKFLEVIKDAVRVDQTYIGNGSGEQVAFKRPNPRQPTIELIDEILPEKPADEPEKEE